MSKHRTQPTAAKPTRREEIAIDVHDMATELLALWTLMPSALARDSAGVLNDDRHATGARDGSPSPANNAVLEATALIETGAWDVAAQTGPLLQLTAPTSTRAILGQLETWWDRLERKQQPLAGHIVGDLKAWVSAARGAVGTRARDYVMAQLCPDHRGRAAAGPVCAMTACVHPSCRLARERQYVGGRPTRLRQLGAVAKINPTLLAGPPAEWHAMIGPQCTRPSRQHTCEHESCHRIRERRHLGDHGPSDWLLTSSGEPRWSPCPVDWPAEIVPVDGNRAFEWRTSRTIRCPHCKRSWTSTTERRLLARELAELGDAPPDSAALIT